MAIIAEAHGATATVYFDGNPIDLERTLAFVSLQFLIRSGDFPNDASKSAYLLSHFRGPALDWSSTVLREHAEWLQDFAVLSERVKRVFGFNSAQLVEQASAEVAGLACTGDLMIFLTRFEELCDRAGMRSDVTKITLLRQKLRSPYTNVFLQGLQYNTYATLRTALIQVYNNNPLVSKGPDVKRKRMTCGRCGKKGHTGSQCQSGN